MRIYRPSVAPGISKRQCDECGFDYPTDKLSKRWDGYVVCKKCNFEKPPSLTPPAIPGKIADLRFPKADGDSLGDRTVYTDELGRSIAEP